LDIDGFIPKEFLNIKHLSLLIRHKLYMAYFHFILTFFHFVSWRTNKKPGFTKRPGFPKIKTFSIKYLCSVGIEFFQTVSQGKFNLSDEIKRPEGLKDGGFNAA
jgi:hypothetical protein